MSSDHKFQVNLSGVIELLSDHLYTGPQVYLRELLQNAVDAIVARQHVEKSHVGEIRIGVIPAKGTNPPVITIEDNGIGLTEDEVHRFLATIGQSSKRESINRSDFIGQFGIGLLSAFVVSEEIVVVTRSLTEGSPTLEWRGRSDGTYSIRQLNVDVPPGTQVHLRAKPEALEHFTADVVRETAAHYGSFLPYSITVTEGKRSWPINSDPPWKLALDDSDDAREELLAYGQATFGSEFLDAIPLKSVTGGVEGVAYVLPQAAAMSGKRTHRVYLKNMLLSEEIDNLLPEWAFFVKCVVNASKLRPTASRESFYEDKKLEQTREQLGECLKQYLVKLAKKDRRRLDAIIVRHYMPIKALALEDDDFYKLFIDWLPFETNTGTTTLGEFFKTTDEMRFVSTVDQFRQVASVATAQGLVVFNAGYSYDQDLLAKLGEVFPDRKATQVDVTELAESFEELTDDERDACFELVQTADRVLQPFRCAVEIRRFRPEQLPTLYTTNDAATFLRSVDQSRDVADELWKGVLDGVSESAMAEAYSQLCLNLNNPLIQRLAKLNQKPVVRRAIEMLYAQALLLGHFPLKPPEMSLLTTGLLGLIELSIDASGDSTTRKKSQ